MDESTGDITKWEWDFNANFPNPEVDVTCYDESSPGWVPSYPFVPYHYENTGIYTVSLTVYGDDCQHTLTRYNYIYVQC